MYKPKVIKVRARRTEANRADFPPAEKALEGLVLEPDPADVEIEAAEERENPLERALEEAAALKTQARQLVEQAQAEADGIRQEARRQGLSEGQEKGAAEAQAQLQPVLAEFMKTMEEAAALKSKILKESEGEIVNLAFEIARKVIGTELAVNPEAATKIISTALAKIAGAKVMKIRTNPQDYEYLKGRSSELFGDAELEADPSVSRGGAVFDLARGSQDAQIEAQLEEIAKSLRADIVEQEQAEGGE